jgi:hypothetical protein
MALWWPPHSAIVDRLDADEKAAKLLRGHKSYWRHAHTNLMRFLETQAPGVWDAVQHCREGRPEITPIEDDDRCSVRLVGCKQYPWCPSCNFEAMCKRASKPHKMFRQATPPGKEPRLWIIELGPGAFEGREWTRWAMENFREYVAAQYLTLEWAFCENVGAVGTFQPYGEQLWAQDHPHVHWVVNGWMPTDAKPKRVKQYDLRDGGREELLAHFAAELSKLSGVPVPTKTLWVDVREPANGARRALRYNMRELIDPTKWRYVRSENIVGTEAMVMRPRSSAPLEGFECGESSHWTSTSTKPKPA